MGGEKTSVVDFVSNVSDILRCDHDDDAGCKQSERSQAQELRGTMRETLPGNAGRLFLLEILWDRWSRGIIFAKEMAESDGMHKTQSELHRSQLLMCSPRAGSCFKPKSEDVTEELGMCCCNKEKRIKIHVKNVTMMVLRDSKRERESDSMKAIGSKEVGRVGEESNARDSIRVVEFDPRVLRETRQMEIDFVNQLDVHRKRPRQVGIKYSRHPNEMGGCERRRCQAT